MVFNPLGAEKIVVIKVLKYVISYYIMNNHRYFTKKKKPRERCQEDKSFKLMNKIL